ncbi:hypothetical protein [Aeromonas caviae]|nr:hypothetical protein [Aeromonas caviae]
MQVEILIAVQPVGLDDEQPVALARPRQQLGLDRSGLRRPLLKVEEPW